MSERAHIAKERVRLDARGREKAQDECRIAGQLQREQGMARTPALLLACRMVNGFHSPSTDFQPMRAHLEAIR